jgi:hypothetical protein
MLLDDHGLIGDTESVAPVGRSGAVQAFSLTLILAARAISAAS